MIFDDLDSSITFKELAEMIMERELSDNFSYDWFCYVNENDDYDEQKIEGANEMIGDQLIPSNQKVAELLGIDEFTKESDIYLKHRQAYSIGFTHQKKKFSLWNATHEKLSIEVRYSAECQREVK